MKCPYCRSKRVVKAGKASVYYPPRQRYLCRNCGKYSVKAKR